MVDMVQHPQTLPQYLYAHAQKHPDRVALRDIARRGWLAVRRTHERPDDTPEPPGPGGRTHGHTGRRR